MPPRPPPNVLAAKQFGRAQTPHADRFFHGEAFRVLVAAGVCTGQAHVNANSPIDTSNAQTKRREFGEMLDTDASLCCSVRQRRRQIQALGEHGRPIVVTIGEVAKESGFSLYHSPIVLNNAPLARYIPDTTKKRIERAAKKLGYRPNLFARSLRNQRSHTVGVMVFDMTDPYCTPILRGIENTSGRGASYFCPFSPTSTTSVAVSNAIWKCCSTMRRSPDRRCQLAIR